MQLFILVELYENGVLIGKEWHVRHKAPDSSPAQYFVKLSNGAIVFIK